MTSKILHFAVALTGSIIAFGVCFFLAHLFDLANSFHVLKMLV